MNRITFIIILVAVSTISLPVLAFSAAKDKNIVQHKNEYGDCLNLAVSQPNDAINAADYWQRQGGDLGALHCKAIALITLKQYQQAAETFVQIGSDERLDNKDRSNFLAQGSHLYLKSAQSIKARDTVNQAINLSPDNVNLFVLRARIAAATGDSLSALKDLDYVLLEDKNNVEALTYRASLYRNLKRYDLAEEALSQAQSTSPSDPYVLLERGILSAVQNDNNTAKQVWQKIVMSYPQSSAATAAKRNLRVLNGGE
jgi:tetratricopeptide (TPR) repeat protein